MPQPCIVACGALTALGNLDEIWQNLCDVRTGLQPLHIVGLEQQYPVGIIADLKGQIGTSARLIDLISRGFFSVPDLAEIACLADCIVTTTKGAADELLDPSSVPWKGQPWQLGDMVAEFLHCQGKIQVVSAACASGTIGLIQAAIQVEDESSEVVIVIGIDILSRFVIAGFASLQALSPDPCRPFDRSRNGLSLGEGMGLMVVTSEKLAVRKGWPILAKIAGCGVACDATHITAPCRKGSGLHRVFFEATKENRIQVGGVNAHGTGTFYNDAMEITAIRSFWKTDSPPIHSVKGAIGHCLGAAGVIEAAIAVLSLHKEQIPPTVGLKQPEIEILPISGAKLLPLSCPSILSCNAGFGGINAGILFNRE